MPKMGRPPKAREDVRSEVITFADTASNKSSYETLASQGGLTLSEWIRDTLNKEVLRECRRISKKTG